MIRFDSLRSELAAAARLAAPVALVQVGMMLMGVVDTMMLGHLSAQALAAGALGHIVTYTGLMMGYGFLSALDPLVSQAYGAGDARALGGHVERGFVLAGVLTVPFVVGFLDVEPMLRWMGQTTAVSRDAADYTRAILWGCLPFFLFLVLRQTLQAMSLVRPAAVSIVLGNVVNVALNWTLIFGHFGAPALGVRGSAWSTSVARWVMFLYMAWASRKALAPYLKKGRGFLAQAGKVREYFVMLRIGTPIAFHNSLELLIFGAAAVFMGQIGVAELGAHQIALNLASLSFMVPLGVSGAAATRVGNAIGRGDMPGARHAAAACLLLGGGAMLVFAALFATLPGPLARLYTTDPAVTAVVMVLLPIAALFQVFDGLQVVASGVLRGAADTTFPAAMALIGYWVLGLPVGWWLGFRGAMGPAGLWLGITLGLTVVAVLLVARIAVRFRREIVAVATSPQPLS